jgi:hypothetical protein
MSTLGWIIMLGSVGASTLFFAWCLWRVLRTPGATEHIHSQADIEPPDQRTP